MSAFVCDPKHFVELAAFAAAWRPGRGGQHVDPTYGRYHDDDEAVQYEGLGRTAELATHYANILYNANIRSVQERYPGSGRDLPGPADLPERIEVTFTDMRNRKVRDPVVILKMCACLDYQSCEADDWEYCRAWKLLQRIRHAAIQTLPGYDNAAWEWN